MLFFELGDDVVDNALVKVFATQESVAVGGQYFKLFVAVDVGDFNDGNIKCAAAQVVHGDFAVFAVAFVHAKRQCGGSRLVDDAFHVQTRDAARIFGGLALAVVKISRHGNHRFGYFFAQIGFGCLFHFTQHFGGNLRGRQLFALRFHPCVAIFGFNDFERHGFDVALHFFVFVFMTNQAFYRVNGVFGVGYGLAFGGRAHQDFAAVQISDDGWRGARAFCIFNHFGCAAFGNSDA